MNTQAITGSWRHILRIDSGVRVYDDLRRARAATRSAPPRRIRTGYGGGAGADPATARKGSAHRMSDPADEALALLGRLGAGKAPTARSLRKPLAELMK